jgi:hypothetical protein
MKKAMGLRGATDAMDYCKSMNSKVGSMLEGRKFAMGGSTDAMGGLTNSSMNAEACSFDAGDRANRKRKRLCRKHARQTFAG